MIKPITSIAGDNPFNRISIMLIIAIMKAPTITATIFPITSRIGFIAFQSLSSVGSKLMKALFKLSQAFRSESFMLDANFLIVSMNRITKGFCINSINFNFTLSAKAITLSLTSQNMSLTGCMYSIILAFKFPNFSAISSAFAFTSSAVLFMSSISTKPPSPNPPPKAPAPLTPPASVPASGSFSTFNSSNPANPASSFFNAFASLLASFIAPPVFAMLPPNLSLAFKFFNEKLARLLKFFPTTGNLESNAPSTRITTTIYPATDVAQFLTVNPKSTNPSSALNRLALIALNNCKIPELATLNIGSKALPIISAMFLITSPIDAIIFPDVS